MANSVDPDQTPNSVVSDLCLHCLQRHVSVLRVITVPAYIMYMKIKFYASLVLFPIYSLHLSFYLNLLFTQNESTVPPNRAWSTDYVKERCKKKKS